MIWPAGNILRRRRRSAVLRFDVRAPAWPSGVEWVAVGVRPQSRSLHVGCISVDNAPVPMQGLLEPCRDGGFLLARPLHKGLS